MGILVLMLLGVLLAACAPTVDPEAEPAVTNPQPAPETDATAGDQVGQDGAETPEPVATATTKPAAQDPAPVKPPLFLEETYGLVIFAKEDAADQQELAELTVSNLESVLTATGALKDVGLAVEQIPEETGGDWAAASLGARMGFWVDAAEDGNGFTVKSNAYFPDDELLLGEGSLGLNRTADAMLEPFTAGSMLEASDILADRLAVIVNAYIGYSALQEGNHSECARRFNSALDSIDQVDVSYNRADASHNALGICLAALGRAEDARVNFEAAIAINPDTASAHYGLGNYYFAQGDYEKAREYFELAVEKTLVDPMATEKTEARTYAGLGNVALISGEYEEAVGYFDKSIAITPDYPAYYLKRAQAKGVLGHDDYAVDLQKCVMLVDQEREPSAYFLEVAADCQQYLDAGFEFLATAGDGSDPAAAAETGAGGDFRVGSTYSSINVRTGPSVEGFAVIGYLYADDDVTVIARTANGVWYLVELETGERGWVNATLLERVSGAAAEVPLAATIPPTPIPTQTMTPRPTVTSLPTAAVTLPANEKPKKKKTPEPTEPTKVPSIPVSTIPGGVYYQIELPTPSP